MRYVNVVGVQFRRAGKIYDYAMGDHPLRAGDAVVVDTERGPSLAHVVVVKTVDADTLRDNPLKPIMRVASGTDLSDMGHMHPDDIVKFARDRVNTLGLDMRVLAAEVQFGGGKAVIYFTSPGRVDFRDLVKDLASGIKARVELKQVGARDEAKVIGGIGVCGREFCCAGFLRDFAPVSIRMAKNQNLALNPAKVSGGCGRLLCCLTYENDAYTDLRKHLPVKGNRVRTPDGIVCKVKNVEAMSGNLWVEGPEGGEFPIHVSKVQVITPEGAAQPQANDGDDDAEGDDAAAMGAMGEKAGAPRPSGDRPREPRRDQHRDHSRDQNRDGRRDQHRDGRRDGRRDGPRDQQQHRDGRRDGQGHPPGGQPAQQGQPQGQQGQQGQHQSHPQGQQQGQGQGQGGGRRHGRRGGRNRHGHDDRPRGDGPRGGGGPQGQSGQSGSGQSNPQQSNPSKDKQGE